MTTNDEKKTRTGKQHGSEGTKENQCTVAVFIFLNPAVIQFIRGQFLLFFQNRRTKISSAGLVWFGLVAGVLLLVVTISVSLLSLTKQTDETTVSIFWLFSNKRR